MPKTSYTLTPTARKHLREAKLWSLSRWGQELTAQYFQDLEKAAELIAKNHTKLIKHKEFSNNTELGLYPVREHYLVFLSLSKDKVAIIDIIRQGRDIPALLNKYAIIIQRELVIIQKKRK